MPTNKIASDGGNIVEKDADGNVAVAGNVTATGTLGVTGLITASSGLIISNKVTTNQSLIWHIGAYDFTYGEVSGVTYNVSSGFCYSTAVDGSIYAPFNVPYKSLGGTVVLDQITLYYYTAAVASDIIYIYLMKTDRDGTLTQVASASDTDEGYGDVALLGGDHTMTDYAYWVKITANNSGADATTVRVYDIKVEAHLE